MHYWTHGVSETKLFVSCQYDFHDINLFFFALSSVGYTSHLCFCASYMCLQ
jgi:hypothetical protein